MLSFEFSSGVYMRNNSSAALQETGVWHNAWRARSKLPTAFFIDISSFSVGSFFSSHSLANNTSSTPLFVCKKRFVTAPIYLRFPRYHEEEFAIFFPTLSSSPAPAPLGKMAMDDAEAQRQIQQMVKFILNEARDKAQEIEARSLEDFNIEKLKLVQQMKDKIRQEYEKKAKKLETQRAIDRSTAVNKARLRRISAQDQVLSEVYSQAMTQLSAVSRDRAKYQKLLEDLIVQGLLRLLESEVIVRCREMDKALVEAVLPNAVKRYSEIMRTEAGLHKTVTATLDKSGRYLPPPPSADNDGMSCCGGVVLMTRDGRITCDNTFDARLRMVIVECAPAIRHTLFPSHQ
ncbi:putative vacuolar atp synthase subunit e [Toxoplasma gondii GAB2-2007-GAL-DOM2]|uniref:Putative vacuolar atp synthase subunit e n=6 Tax=Toxoplasma gondii TaxID=5811 RepID=A0A086Q378_TOXGO|nr:putative vacuolar atp synthase subunit e [Toxoplasma gondii p89]KFG33274.1 putative vacuolar atp synthase subunit e [Toxoplasma gondii GAB2-2007-GAL-DOM2]KFG45335.1 putative vacuolar atp synthase subunit e [Toxoplasma gondii FOU]KFH07060.1 putative vacuolar atp synthase subunit e [Toxoplasma gondii MAS]PUA85982.1 putative vacuolar atp synthase subunit e [Toxoplasma gondii TgCATBr9]RQX67874.1 putative vacuolar atp synthase subunit e [Toxoplasma gondii CAST]